MSSITYPAGAAETKTTATRTGTLPFYIYAVVFASFSIVVGLVWDISWHMSIGRDGLFSPPHLATYLGAVTAGLFSGYHVLRLTFAGHAGEKQESIRFWRFFYGSLGALFCIWGAFTMITSAPFDDWWHSTFGLDVQILSPPHTVLLLGMITIQFGAMVSVMALQNRTGGSANFNKQTLSWCFTLSSGFLLVMLFTIASEYLGRQSMHASGFYVVSAMLFPLFMVAVSKASATRWGATYMALVYMVFMAIMVWVLPLFPAEPKLGPVQNHITHYQSFNFPLLLLFPALAIDLFNQRLNGLSLLKALLISIAFVFILFAVQWPFGSFLTTTYARNWFFGTTSWYFGSDPNHKYRYAFAPNAVSSAGDMVKGLGIAIAIGTISSWLGLVWGSWMKSVKR
ncbi:hypothetical protein [Mucilaginibacter sp. CSA2-8R]|uniref:hypothetical protein n=1 Tax=Mucilaginibacter sp. CSA2-8R TaxID=3141542 RepID=UPI00315DCB25